MNLPGKPWKITITRQEHQVRGKVNLQANVYFKNTSEVWWGWSHAKTFHIMHSMIDNTPEPFCSLPREEVFLPPITKAD